MYAINGIYADFLVSSINFILAFWIINSTKIRTRKTFTIWFCLFFFSISFSGIAKGLALVYPPDSSVTNLAIEKACFLILGISGLASWNLGARLSCNKIVRLNIYRLSYLSFGAMSSYIIFVDSVFYVVLVHNAFGLIFFLFSLIAQFYKKWDKEIAFGVLGIFTTFLALLVRQLAVGFNDAIFGFDIFFNSLCLFSSIMVYLAAKLLIDQDYELAKSKF